MISIYTNVNHRGFSLAATLFGGREGGREEGMEGRDGGSEGGRKGGRDGGKEGVREGERKVRGMERHSREPQRRQVTS